jgi:hypothetical protein
MGSGNCHFLLGKNRCHLAQRSGGWWRLRPSGGGWWRFRRSGGGWCLVFPIQAVFEREETEV